MKILRSRRSGGVVNQRFGLLPIQSFINKWVARSALICLRLIAQFSGNLIFWDRLFSCPSVYTFSELWKNKILGFLYQTNSLIQIYKWVARSALICCRLISHLMFSLLAALVFILSVKTQNTWHLSNHWCEESVLCFKKKGKIRKFPVDNWQLATYCAMHNVHAPFSEFWRC